MDHSLEQPARRKRRWWLIPIWLAGCVLIGLIPLGLAMLPPGEFRPARLDADERNIAAKQFYRRMMDFDDLAQSNAPFEFSFTAEQINRYLSSMDEIAAMLPGGQAGQALDLLDAAGLCDPAVAITGGRITLMIRAGGLGTVVSADLRPTMDADGRLRVPLSGVRVGRLPIPRGLVRGQIARSRDKLAALRASQEAEPDVPGEAPEVDLASVAADYSMRMILAALEGDAVVPEGKYRRRRLRLTGIEAEGGTITVRVVPIPPIRARTGAPGPVARPGTSGRTQPASSRVNTQSSPSTGLSR